MPRLTRADIEDISIVDAVELAAPKSGYYASSITVVSTNSGTKRVVVSSVDIIHDVDTQLEAGDFVVITGTSGGLGNGTFTVASIVDTVTFVVTETIGTSTSGSVSFQYPAGATKVGVDIANLHYGSSTDLQTLLTRLDWASLLENGAPETSYREIVGGVFPSSVTWYNNSDKAHKILELTITRDASKKPTSEVYKIYNTSDALIATISDAMTYSGAYETSRTRTRS